MWLKRWRNTLRLGTAISWNRPNAHGRGAGGLASMAEGSSETIGGGTMEEENGLVCCCFQEARSHSHLEPNLCRGCAIAQSEKTTLFPREPKTQSFRFERGFTNSIHYMYIVYYIYIFSHSFIMNEWEEGLYTDKQGKGWHTHMEDKISNAFVKGDVHAQARTLPY